LNCGFAVNLTAIWSFWSSLIIKALKRDIETSLDEWKTHYLRSPVESNRVSAGLKDDYRDLLALGEPLVQ